MEIINLQLARRKENIRRVLNWLFISICIILIIIFICISKIDSAYMEWDYNDPELAVLGVGIHVFEWIFVRISPIIFIGSIIGICFTIKKR